MVNWDSCPSEPLRSSARDRQESSGTMGSFLQMTTLEESQEIKMEHLCQKWNRAFLLKWNEWMKWNEMTMKPAIPLALTTLWANLCRALRTQFETTLHVIWHADGCLFLLCRTPSWLNRFQILSTRLPPWSHTPRTENFIPTILVQSLSCVWLFPTPWMAARQVSLSFKHAETHIHWVNDVIQPSYPPAFSLFSIKVFPSELAICISWPKYWSFSISPSNEYSGFISFRIGWFDLLAIQGILKNLLQHHSSKTSILRC